MNFIFISPHFPETYWAFCAALKRNGVNVLAIADAPYDQLRQELKANITEYYKVDNIGNYDAMYRAIGYFAHKYGRIDWIESNNEFWLEQDARLRTDFNVTTGIRNGHVIESYKEKSEMKKVYTKGGVPTARQIKGSRPEKKLWEFVKTTGYPIIAKPDVGVGAGDTHKLHNDDEFKAFLENSKEHVKDYVIEEFISGQICSYDAVINSQGEPIFESTAMWPPSIMDIVNKQLELHYYVAQEVPAALREIGRKTVKAFGVTSRFIHFEFFCLDRDREGLGKKGDFVALEVNMRPAGGYSPDMMNYTHSTNVFQIWADMVAFDECRTKPGERKYCSAYVGRRSNRQYVYSHEELCKEFAGKVMMSGPIAEVLSGAMGNYFYVARLDDEAEAEKFIEWATKNK